VAGLFPEPLPERNTDGSDTEAVSALAVSTPMPGMASSRRPVSSPWCQAWMSFSAAATSWSRDRNCRAQ